MKGERVYFRHETRYNSSFGRLPRHSLPVISYFSELMLKPCAARNAKQLFRDIDVLHIHPNIYHIPFDRKEARCPKRIVFYTFMSDLTFHDMVNVAEKYELRRPSITDALRIGAYIASFRHQLIIVPHKPINDTIIVMESIYDLSITLEYVGNDIIVNKQENPSLFAFVR